MIDHMIDVFGIPSAGMKRRIMDTRGHVAGASFGMCHTVLMDPRVQRCAKWGLHAKNVDHMIDVFGIPSAGMKRRIRTHGGTWRMRHDVRNGA